MDEKLNYDKLKNKNIFITGATGLVGSNLVKKLIDINANKNLNLRIIILVRSIEIAKTIFEKYFDSEVLKFVLGDIEQLPDIKDKINYIIHGASPTASKYFIDKPIETIQTLIYGTNNVLKLGKEKNIESFVLLSTMEVYGTPKKGEKIKDDICGRFDTTEVRNCYPLGKQMCENLCYSYFSEYQVPIKIARLTQTFGPGVSYNDKRVFAEFARCAIEHKNIILKTKGETERSYLYTDDAVLAILTILLKGSNGEVYNVANEDTYCSIYEMANLVANKYNINIEMQIQNIKAQGYADTLYIDLDTSKIQKLGWKPTTSLKEMYRQMIQSMKEVIG